MHARAMNKQQNTIVLQEVLEIDTYNVTNQAHDDDHTRLHATAWS